MRSRKPLKEHAYMACMVPLIFFIFLSFGAQAKSNTSSECRAMGPEESLVEATEKTRAMGNCKGGACSSVAVSSQIIPHSEPHLKSIAQGRVRNFTKVDEKIWAFTGEGLRDNQTALMKTFKLNPQEYLELSKATWGVLYAESKHFESPWYAVKSSPIGSGIPLAKKINCLKNGVGEDSCNTDISHGPTQIKKVPDEVRGPPFSVEEIELWKSPEKSAIATLAILAKNLKFSKAIGKKNPSSPCAQDPMACAIFAYNRGTKKIILNQLAPEDLQKGYVKIVKEQMQQAKVEICIIPAGISENPEGEIMEPETTEINQSETAQ